MFQSGEILQNIPLFDLFIDLQFNCLSKKSLTDILKGTVA